VFHSLIDSELAMRQDLRTSFPYLYMYYVECDMMNTWLINMAELENNVVSFQSMFHMHYVF